MTADDFPGHLRTLRLTTGITQTTAATAAGVCLSTWGHWEQGTKRLVSSVELRSRRR